MRVYVTTEDIRDGKVGDGSADPVALAINRAAGQRAQLYRDHIAIGQRVFRVPVRVQRFIRKFDGDGEVAPFGFRLVETNRTVLRLQRLTRTAQ